jgi:hypothetical protein
MTKSALDNYKEARNQRLGKNDARRIRAERDKARSPTSGAARRWPFELLQNAHDPGPRNGSALVETRVSATDSTLAFKHNGRPFTPEDLAALLSGGSNKEYDSPDTSGRFGTGFLITHVLSPRVTLRGVIANGSGYEQFHVDLDRSGDEEAILENTKAAEDGIGAAASVDMTCGLWTAEFEYPIDAHDAVESGIQALRSATPFLFGTCQHLGRVTIEGRDGLVESWRSEEPTQFEQGGVTVRERRVTLESNGSVSVYRVLRLVPANADDVGLVILLRANREHWKFQPAPDDIPRVFARFPIRASTFLPISCVIDGRFDVQEERDRIAMNDGDKRAIEAALRVIPVAVELGLSKNWEQGHWLARVARVDSAFSETRRDEELEWWNAQLREVANRLAQLPLVNTTTGFWPAVRTTEKRWADFVLPRYSKSNTMDLFPEALAWELASITTVLNPPVLDLVSDWNEISAGWESLEVPVRRLGLKEIAEEIRRDTHKLGDLPVHGDPRKWLTRFLGLLGELPDGHDCTELVKGLLPNQGDDGHLCSPAALKRDVNIPVALKDIAKSIGCGVRERLLDTELASHGPIAFIKKLIPGELTESEVLKECLDHLTTELPDGHAVDADSMHLVDGSFRLLGYISTTRTAEEGASLAQRCPLFTREGSIAHYSARRKVMAPVGAWPERARSFADIYAPGRVLADAYCETSAESCDIVRALVAWGIAFPEPLVRDRRAELKDTLLQHLTHAEVQGVIVRDEEFSQVALLGTEIIQRCQEDEERAALLLGFVLAYLAPRDQGWQRLRSVIGRREGNEVPLEVCDALWVAELKSRAWVPMPGEEGNEQVVPSPANLDPLLKKCKEWLVGNDAAIEFLIKCFGFDVLNLRLEALPEAVRGSISEGLATLVQMGGSDTKFYQQVVENLAAQKQREAEKARNRQFGLAVQDAIQSYLTDRGLTVKVIDRGYDLDVEAPDDVPLIEAGTHQLSAGPYRVEVKATTTGEVRLTPAQAKVASQDDDFVLCVVDLRGCEPVRLAETWTAADIEPYARMVTGLRQSVSETHDLVEAATEQQIAIRYEGKLRYGVPTTIWERGTQINSWVAEIAPNLIPA